MRDEDRDREVQELSLTAGQLKRRREQLDGELKSVKETEGRVLERLRAICPHADVVEHVHRTVEYDFRLGPKRVCKTCGLEEDGVRGFKVLTAEPAERIPEAWCSRACCRPPAAR